MALARPHKYLDAAALERWANLHRVGIFGEWEECQDPVGQIDFWDWLGNEYPDEFNKFECWFGHVRSLERQRKVTGNSHKRNR